MHKHECFTLLLLLSHRMGSKPIYLWYNCRSCSSVNESISYNGIQLLTLPLPLPLPHHVNGALTSQRFCRCRSKFTHRQSVNNLLSTYAAKLSSLTFTIYLLSWSNVESIKRKFPTQRWIQHFPRGANPKGGGVPTYYLAKFSQNCM